MNGVLAGVIVALSAVVLVRFGFPGHLAHRSTPEDAADVAVPHPHRVAAVPRLRPRPAVLPPGGRRARSEGPVMG